MGLPYTEQKLSNDSMLREFREDVPPDDLEWHMDRRDRIVTVVEGSGWMLQLESGLPFEMVPGRSYPIRRESWHRVIKGTGPLHVLIREY